MSNENRKITVYSTPFCAPCDALKSYLTAREIPFSVRDPMMDDDAADFLATRNIRSAPALEVDSDIYAGAASSDAQGRVAGAAAKPGAAPWLHASRGTTAADRNRFWTRSLPTQTWRRTGIVRESSRGARIDPRPGRWRKSSRPTRTSRSARSWE